MSNIEEKSVTHLHQKDHLSKDEITQKMQEIKSRLIQKYGKNTAKYNELNKILDDLSEFELGRFLICNGSLSGYWTDYVVDRYKEKQLKNKLEKYLLEKLPGNIATRERANIFQKLLKELMMNNSVFCSIPCGLMAELITLDIDENIKIKCVGIDLDGGVFEKARSLAKKYNKADEDISFIKEDAWSIKINEKYNIITSNGLNLYEKNDARIVLLYQNFFRALKPGGTFISSVASTPEEWDMGKIDQENLKVQKMLFEEVLEPAWCNRRSAKKSESQLEAAGFGEIEFFWDTQKMFYTFKAKKLIN